MFLVPPEVCDILANRAGGKKWQNASMWRMPLSAPQLPARKPRTLDQRLELRPHDGGMDAPIEGALRKSAIGAGHDVLAPQEIGKTQDAFGDELRMLDHVRDVADHAGDQQLAGRQLGALPYLPFMLVAGIAGLDHVGAGTDFQNEIDDVPKRHIARMRAGPAAPADVITYVVLRDACERGVERFDEFAQPAPVVREASGRDHAVVHC